MTKFTIVAAILIQIVAVGLWLDQQRQAFSQGVGVFPTMIPSSSQRTGSGTTNGTTATTIIAAVPNYSLYVRSMQCSNPGSTQSVVTLNDGASSSFINPPGSGNNPVFEIPLKIATNTALTFTPSVAITGQVCNAQAYIAP